MCRQMLVDILSLHLTADKKTDQKTVLVGFGKILKYNCIILIGFQGLITPPGYSWRRFF